MVEDMKSEEKNNKNNNGNNSNDSNNNTDSKKNLDILKKAINHTGDLSFSTNDNSLHHEHKQLELNAAELLLSKQEAKNKLDLIRKSHEEESILLNNKIQNHKMLQDEKLKLRLKDKREKKISRGMPVSKGSMRNVLMAATLNN